MIHSLKLGGLSEELAKDIGLYDVLSMSIGPEGSSSSATSGGVIGNDGQEMPKQNEAGNADHKERPGGTAQITEPMTMLAYEALPGALHDVGRSWPEPGSSGGPSSWPSSQTGTSSGEPSAKTDSKNEIWKASSIEELVWIARANPKKKADCAVTVKSDSTDSDSVDGEGWEDRDLGAGVGLDLETKKVKKKEVVDTPSRSGPYQRETLAGALAVGGVKRGSTEVNTTRKPTKIIKKDKKTFFAPRKDAPIVRQPGRGSRTKALDVGRTAGTKRRALKALRQDEVAPSAKGPKKSRWKTWVDLHVNWFGKEVAPLPLTCQSIAAVLCQLKEGRYASAADYMSTAKAQHLRRHEWSTRLARQHTISVRSALRGIAPGKSCEEIPLEEFVAGAAAIEKPLQSDGWV